MGEAPLFRLVKVNEGASVVTASLWEAAPQSGEWLYNGNLTMTPEAFGILQGLLEIGARSAGVGIAHVDCGWLATETGFTRKEWS